MCWSLSPLAPRQGSRRPRRAGVSGTVCTWFLGCAASSVAPGLRESLGLVPVLRLRGGLVPVVFALGTVSQAGSLFFGCIFTLVSLPVAFFISFSLD